MENRYIRGKARETARILAIKHGMDIVSAERLTESIWSEARRSILAMIGGRQWQSLSFTDKAAVCGIVIKRLLDKKNGIA